MFLFYTFTVKHRPNGLAQVTSKAIDAEVLCSYRVRKGSSTATVSNERLWVYLVSSWKKVTPDCIRNCFVQVLILSEHQKTRLLGLGVETKADQVNRLQEELRERYVGNEETIADHKGFSVLNYLSMISSEGPSPAIVEVAHEIMGREEYKGAFQQLKENGFVDDDNSEDSDNDTWARTTTNLTWITKTRSQLLVVEIALHNSTVEEEVPIEEFPSPPSSPYAEEVYSQEYIFKML
ncbi:hypothetical protein BGZ54_006829 [Gamsiella multidivaricata]|nr:hypothetical protein BGZ54_006829 [Gamsiella multidivaricata]